MKQERNGIRKVKSIMLQYLYKIPLNIFAKCVWKNSENILMNRMFGIRI